MFPKFCGGSGLRSHRVISVLVVLGAIFLFSRIYGRQGHPLKTFVPGTQTISVPSPYTQPLPAVRPGPTAAVDAAGGSLAILVLGDYTPALRDPATKAEETLAMAMVDSAKFGARHPLATTLIPSLVRTVGAEDKVVVYVGYDYEDPLFDDEAARKGLDTAIAAAAKQTRNLRVRYLPFFGLQSAGEVAKINALAERAHADGADYQIRVTQGMEFTTPGWAKTMSAELLANPIYPGFGAVLLRNALQPERPTFVMVSRTHVHMMRALLPIPFQSGLSEAFLYALYKPWGSSYEELEVYGKDVTTSTTTSPLASSGLFGATPTLTETMFAQAGVSKEAFARQMTKLRKRLNLVVKQWAPLVSVNMHSVHTFDGCLMTEDACLQEKKRLHS